MDDDTFDPAFWGRMFIIAVAVFVLVAGAAAIEGYSLRDSLTAGLWLGPGFAVFVFAVAIVWWVVKRR